MNGTNTLSISELRKKVSSVVEDVFKTKKTTVILKRSKPKAVLVDVDYFNALEEHLYDVSDAKEAERAKKEKKDLLGDYVKKRWAK